MPSIELTDEELAFLKFVMATLLLQATQSEPSEKVGTIIAINEALKNAKH